MPRPAIPESTTTGILRIWAEYDRPSATRVFELANSRLGDARPSLRKVQQIIAKAKPKSQIVPPDNLVEPWDDDWPKSPDEIEILFRLMYFVYEFNAPKLDCRIAKWALRLRLLFDDGPNNSINYLYSWAAQYARRERASQMLGESSPFTADLDTEVMFHVWGKLDYSDNLGLYQKAIEKGDYPEARDWFDDLEVLFPGGTRRMVRFRAATQAEVQSQFKSIEKEENTNARNTEPAK